MRNRVFFVVSLIVISLLLAACVVQQPTTGASSDAGTAEAFKIGLVTDVGEVDDKSFNQSAWEGAQLGAVMIGGEADYIETKDAKRLPGQYRRIWPRMTMT